MNKTYVQLQKQIAKLQEEAAAIKAKEVAGVVEKIREAIAFYGLTTEDLFPPAAARKSGARKSARRASAAPTLPAAKVSMQKPGTKAKAKSEPKTKAPKKPSAPPKYTDGAGKTWNGIGKRPGWYVAAIAAGKTPKDLEIAL